MRYAIVSLSSFSVELYLLMKILDGFSLEGLVLFEEFVVGKKILGHWDPQTEGRLRFLRVVVQGSWDDIFARALTDPEATHIKAAPFSVNCGPVSLKNSFIYALLRVK